MRICASAALKTSAALNTSYLQYVKSDEGSSAIDQGVYKRITNAEGKSGTTYILTQHAICKRGTQLPE